MNKNIPHVVVIGAGFGGLHVAQKLAGKPVNVTLVDKRNYQIIVGNIAVFGEYSFGLKIDTIDAGH